MARDVAKGLFLATVALVALSSCRGRPATGIVQDAAAGGPVSGARDESPSGGDGAPAGGRLAEMLRAEERAVVRNARRECERPVTVYEGSVAVAAKDYVQTVERGEDFVDAPIEGLDEVITRATRVEFTLEYPFERPFTGVVTGEVTLRRTIDAIRAGFRAMYEGTTQREIPGLYNKDVVGPYGQAFHAIDDLVIEEIDLCADDRLVIGIGS